MEEDKKVEMNEEVRNEERTSLVQANDNYVISDFGGIGRNSTTKTSVFTNITDQKKIFNLENKVDCMLNDCEGDLIRVKEVLIKQFEKPLKEPIINDDTGEILKEKEYSMSCVIVDDNNKSYATGSKSFTIQLMRYLQMRARMGMKDEPFEIKIIKKKVGQNGNKALSFELI